MTTAIAKQSLLQPTTMQEAMEFSEMLAKSSMVPPAFKGKAGDILVAVQWGYEVGLPPMSALQNIAVINGKPSIYGDAALALITSHKEYAGHKEWVDGETAHCLIARNVNGKIVETERTFSMTQAKKAKLAGKQGPWSQYPERMLQMRARGYAMRDAFPDALKGVITAEEAQDHQTEMRDVTPPQNALDRAFDDQPAVIEPDPEEPVAEEAPIDDDDLLPFVIVDTTDIDNREADGFTPVDDLDDWSERFTNAAGAIINDKDMTAVERRHALSILKKANEDGLVFLQEVAPETAKSIISRYNKAIKRLSVQAKDED